MQKKLPVRANIEHLKAQAKDLLEAFRRKDAEAIERVRAHLPAAHGTRDAREMPFALHDAQSVIAREYGCESWARLRAQVESAPLTPEMLRALMSSPLPSEVEKALLAAASEERPRGLSLPPILPVLPLRNSVLSVGAIAPLNIGRRSSLAAIQAAKSGANLLAVFAQKEDANETPSEADLHPVGCAAELLSEIRTSERGKWIVVRATDWISLDALEKSEPFLLARVSRFAVHEEQSSEIDRLDRELRERVREIAAKLPHSNRLLQRIERMSTLELADITIANLSCSVQDKARYASEPRLVARLEYLLELVSRAA